MHAARRPSRAGSKPDRPPRQSIRQVASTWLAGIRFSGFSIIMMGVLVLAVVVLAPSIAEYAKQSGLTVIADGKRNDIGSTCEAYADAYLGGKGGGFVRLQQLATEHLLGAR